MYMPLQNICSQSDDFENSFRFLNEKLSCKAAIYSNSFFAFFQNPNRATERKRGVRTSKMMSVLGTSINSICARDLWYTRSWCWLFITRNTPKREEAPLKRKGTITRAT